MNLLNPKVDKKAGLTFQLIDRLGELGLSGFLSTALKAIMIVLVISIAPLAGQLNAQTFEDVMGIRYNWYPMTKMKNLDDGHVLKDSKIGIDIFDFWLSVPIIDVGKTKIYSQVSYGRLQFHYDDQFATFVNRPDILHEIKVLFVMENSISDLWSVIGTFIPSINSDLDDGLGKDDIL